MATQYDIVRLDTVASTQDVATARHAETGRTTLVIADRQIAGRGRQGRDWYEPASGLFSSLAFSSDWRQDTFPRLPLCAGVAVRSAVLDVAGVPLGLKWPNDLILHNAKVGGILVEASGARVTVGCGLNLFWPDAPEFASAISEIEPGGEFAESLANHWVVSLLELVAMGPDAWPRDEYVGSCVTLGAGVRWETGSGVAQGVDDDGALIVSTNTGLETLHQGDVHMLADS